MLSISVSGDLIQKEYDEFYQAIAKDAKVPGFRPGKAPREVLMTHYRSEAHEKVLERLVLHSFQDAVRDEKIQFLGKPQIREVEFTDNQLSFEALLETPHEIGRASCRERE